MNWRVLTKVGQRGNAEKENAAAVMLGVQERARKPKGNAAAIIPSVQERARKRKENAAKASAVVPAVDGATGRTDQDYPYS